LFPLKGDQAWQVGIDMADEIGHGVEFDQNLLLDVGNRSLAALRPNRTRWEKGKALLHAVNARAGAISIGRYRRIAQKSRLLFADHVTFSQLSIAGDRMFPDQLMMGGQTQGDFRLRQNVGDGESAEEFPGGGYE
jgi:hypothetical protein